MTGEMYIHCLLFYSRGPMVEEFDTANHRISSGFQARPVQLIQAQAIPQAMCTQSMSEAHDPTISHTPNIPQSRLNLGSILAPFEGISLVSQLGHDIHANAFGLAARPWDVVDYCGRFVPCVVSGCFALVCKVFWPTWRTWLPDEYLNSNTHRPSGL